MKGAYRTCLFVAMATVISLVAVGQEAPPSPAAPKPSTSFTRRGATDPALPPVSMLSRLLALTPEQERTVRLLYAEHNKSYDELMSSKASLKERQARLRELRKSTEKKLEAVLTPQQIQQMRSLDPESILVDRLTVALKLSQEQSRELLAVMREQTASIRAIEKEAVEKGWNEQQRKEKLAELRKQIEEKVNKILTPEQQQKLKQILRGEVPTANTPSKSEQPAPPQGTP